MFNIFENNLLKCQSHRAGRDHIEAVRIFDEARPKQGPGTQTAAPYPPTPRSSYLWKTIHEKAQ